jgi:hypothetical protein
LRTLTSICYANKSPPNTACAERVTDGDGTTVDVGPLKDAGLLPIYFLTQALATGDMVRRNRGRHASAAAHASPDGRGGDRGGVAPPPPNGAIC